MGLDISVYKPVPNYPGCSNYFNLNEDPCLKVFSSLAFDKPEEFYDLEKAASEAGLTLEDLSTIESLGEDGTFSIKTNKGLTLELKPDLTTVVSPHIAVEEVGYQRRGANKKFYEDMNLGLIPCLVLEGAILKDHWKKYFSDEDPDAFKNNIVRHFVEGSTFICYH